MNLNKVILGGRLTADPEMRFTTNGKAVSNFSIAINTYAGRDDDGNPKNHVEFVNVTVWGKVAESVSGSGGKKGMEKGQQILVEGEIRSRKFTVGEGDNKVERTSTFVNAYRIQKGFKSKSSQQQNTATEVVEEKKEDDALPF